MEIPSTCCRHFFDPEVPADCVARSPPPDGGCWGDCHVTRRLQTLPQWAEFYHTWQSRSLLPTGTSGFLGLSALLPPPPIPNWKLFSSVCWIQRGGIKATWGHGTWPLGPINASCNFNFCLIFKEAPYLTSSISADVMGRTA